MPDPASNTQWLACLSMVVPGDFLNFDSIYLERARTNAVTALLLTIAGSQLAVACISNLYDQFTNAQTKHWYGLYFLAMMVKEVCR